MTSERTRGPGPASLDIGIRPGPVVTISGEIEAQVRLRIASSNPSLVTEAMAYGEALISTGEFPELTALAEQARLTGSQIGPLEHLDRQFETGLAALLDGIERHYGIP